MAHFAELNDNGVVQRVIVVSNKDTADANAVEKESIGQAFCERLFGGNWVQTSYNGNFRKRYAGIGYKYDAALDAFIAPQPYPSWTLNEVEWLWEPPVPQPSTVPDGTHIFDDGNAAGSWVWDESTVDWVWIDYGN